MPSCVAFPRGCSACPWGRYGCACEYTDGPFLTDGHAQLVAGLLLASVVLMVGLWHAPLWVKFVWALRHPGSKRVTKEGPADIDYEPSVGFQLARCVVTGAWLVLAAVRVFATDENHLAVAMSSTTTFQDARDFAAIHFVVWPSIAFALQVAATATSCGTRSCWRRLHEVAHGLLWIVFWLWLFFLWWPSQWDRSEGVSDWGYAYLLAFSLWGAGQLGVRLGLHLERGYLGLGPASVAIDLLLWLTLGWTLFRLPCE